MRRRITIYILSILMMFCFCGCGHANNDDDKKYNPNTVYDYGDEYFRGIYDRVTLDYDCENYLYEDFQFGIDSRLSIVNAVWGSKEEYSHNGFQKENVFLTDDGLLALRINGNYYRGESLGETNGLRSGGGLVSDFDAGPGRFEICMKAAPRVGTCSAFWTYQYNSSNPEENGWNEIDIEILGGGASTFDKPLYTTWQNASRPNTEAVAFDNIILNDGKWHVYAFDWYTDYLGTGKGRIDWFIDGKLCHWTENNVSLKSGNIWLGGYSPDINFVGDADFDTTWMLVDWVQYTPFKDMSGWEDTDYDNSFNKHIKTYPVKRITIIDDMVNQRISNGGFEYVDSESNVPYQVSDELQNYAAVGWKKIYSPEGTCSYEVIGGSGGNSLKVTDGKIGQSIHGVFEGYKYDFSCNAMIFPESNAQVEIVYYDNDGVVLKRQVLETAQKSNDFQKIQSELIAPENCKSLSIFLKNGVFDDVSCLFKGME